MDKGVQIIEVTLLHSGCYQGHIQGSAPASHSGSYGLKLQAQSSSHHGLSQYSLTLIGLQTNLDYQNLDHSYPWLLPCAHAQGVKQSVLSVRRLSSVITKIARSWVLGICVCCNYHRLVDVGEKLVCLLRIAEHGLLALQIVHFLFSLPVVYWSHPLHVLMWLDYACSTLMQVRITKSWSEFCASWSATMAEECAGYVL